MLYQLRLSITRLLSPQSLRHCTVCGKDSLKFFDGGVIEKRAEACCPQCGSLERHRLLLPVLREKTNLFEANGLKLLHVAPEKFLHQRLRVLPDVDYISADLEPGRADVEMDITNIQYEDNSFDAILCSHVLEHVPDDRKAMREFFRVLKPGGWAVLAVPINVDETVEDPSITDPAERIRLFGQDDHVRRYGPDYFDRLEEAGFQIERLRGADLMSDTRVLQCRIDPDEEVPVCKKLR